MPSRLRCAGRKRCGHMHPGEAAGGRCHSLRLRCMCPTCTGQGGRAAVDRTASLRCREGEAIETPYGCCR